MTLAIERNQVTVSCIDEETLPKYRIGEQVLLIDQNIPWEQWKQRTVLGVLLSAGEMTYAVKFGGDIRWLGDGELCRPWETPHFDFEGAF